MSNKNKELILEKILINLNNYLTETDFFERELIRDNIVDCILLTGKNIDKARDGTNILINNFIDAYGN